ncbi:MAG: DUF3524 domain-containing protein [Spirochaetia bacterium]|nr:DUF3524 domain-containing protein [Spirochaetia bacterium]
MKILALEPFYGGSHKSWLDSLVQYSRHDYKLLTMPPRWWKYRMYAGAITLAKRALEDSFAPDIILASDMLDLSAFLSLTRGRFSGIPALLYFHENQFAYPQNTDYNNRFDNHYKFINYTSALCADKIFFNSKYNRDTFFEGLENMLRSFPEYRNMDTIDKLQKKSSVLPLGIDFKRFEKFGNADTNDPAVILWNHRWEHDKNPEDFFNALKILKNKEIDFRLIICGQSYQISPTCFAEAEKEFKKEILHMGTVKNKSDYIRLLRQSDIIFVTSNHDFFGISVAEAIYCGAFPLLPNRVAYPELFKKSRFPDCYYESNGIEKIIETVNNIQTLKEKWILKLQKEVFRFDWSKMIDVYDETFEKQLKPFSIRLL